MGGTGESPQNVNILTGSQHFLNPSCDGQCHASTWLGMGGPGVVGHTLFWMFL